VNSFTEGEIYVELEVKYSCSVCCDEDIANLIKNQSLAISLNLIIANLISRDFWSSCQKSSLSMIDMAEKCSLLEARALRLNVIDHVCG